MSNVSNDTQKADQIAYRFYTKLTLVVNHARATAEPNLQAKVDKWFNLETPDADVREHTRIYRELSTSLAPPTFQLQVLLCIPELTLNQVLAFISPDSSRAPVEPTPKYILLESWTIDFVPHQHRYGKELPDVAPPTIYKHGISLFRSIYTLLRILPAWKLARRLRRPAGGNFSIIVRVESAELGASSGVLGFESLVQNSRLPQEMHEFPAVPHPMGSLTVSVTYLTSPNFRVVDRESLLSSRFLSQDEGPEFVPTLVRNKQRDSLTSSPSSIQPRTSLPRSPPRSVADQFVLPPAHTRTTSLSGGSPRPYVAQAMTRAISGTGLVAGSSSNLSDASSVRHGPPSASSREDLAPSALARLRRESLGTGRTDSPSPVPIRRPPLNSVKPFKSGTLSSGSPSLHSPSPSVRQQSPLTTGGPSLPSRPAHSSPTSSRAPALPSPISAAARLPGSPIIGIRPSPPTGLSSLGGPSSLSDRRSLVSVDGVGGGSGESHSPRPPGAKRYSSSFGYRYEGNASSAAVGSEGSPGSGTGNVEQSTNASNTSVNTEEEDINAFVHDIESRKPLSGLREQKKQAVSSVVEPKRKSPTVSIPTRSRTMSGPEPMLITASAVDERLNAMNDTFLASLQGLGGRRGDRQGHIKNNPSTGTGSTGSSTARAPSSGTSTIGRRTLEPITFARQRNTSAAVPPLSRRQSSSSAGIGIPLPTEYSRPRFSSTGSARSALSIRSGEVLGRMDPEPDDDGRRSPFGHDFTE